MSDRKKLWAMMVLSAFIGGFIALVWGGIAIGRDLPGEAWWGFTLTVLVVAMAALLDIRASDGR